MKIDREDDTVYMVKVHSEYGDTFYPRICLRLSPNKPVISKLHFTIDVVGENIRSQATKTLFIEYDEVEKDYRIIYGRSKKYLRELLEKKEELDFTRTIGYHY